MAATPAVILYHLFEDPRFFHDWGLKGKPFVLAGEIIGWTINFLIIGCTMAFCAESMEAYSPDMNRNPASHDLWEERWWTMEIGSVVLFSMDWVIRGVGSLMAGYGAAFVGDALNWIDFLSIAPFYVRIFVPDFVDLRFLRILRLTRILRALPSAKHGCLGGVVMEIIQTSVGALFIPLYFMILALIVFSSVMFYVEKTQAQVCHLGGGEIVDPWDSSNITKGNEGCMELYGCECSGTMGFVTYDGVECVHPMRHPETL